jgi:CRISPR-associated protein Cmr4
LTGKAIAMVSDSDFRDYVRYSTDVVTRVKLGEGKTVERGALWTEEHLPSDTLLYSFAASWTPVVNGAIKDASQVMERLASLLTDQWVIRVGGKETVGHGFVSVRVLGGGHV